MDIQIHAIYEDGVLKPLEPVSLNEREQVRLTISPSGSTADASSELSRQHQAIDELLAEFNRLPQPNGSKGFSGTDHDTILYGRNE